jgi:hypothetical protein
MASRREVVQDFDALCQDVDQLLAGGYQKAGAWDLRQVCSHLNLAMEKSLAGFNKPAPWVVRRFLGPLILRRILSTRRMRSGVPAPAEFVCKETVPVEEVVTRFKELVQRVKSHQGEFQPHPFFGPMDPEQWRQLHLIHGAHHLSFLVPA